MREFYPAFLVLKLLLFYQCNAKICPELGPSLENLSRIPFFPHFAVDPECIEKVQPRVDIFQGETLRKPVMFSSQERNFSRR